MYTPLEYVVLYVTQVVQVIVFSAGCYFFGISMFGWIKKKENGLPDCPLQKRFALVIAAHNEELVMRPCNRQPDGTKLPEGTI